MNQFCALFLYQQNSDLSFKLFWNSLSKLGIYLASVKFVLDWQVTFLSSTAHSSHLLHLLKKKAASFSECLFFCFLVFFHFKAFLRRKRPESVLVWLLRTAEKSVHLVLEKAFFDLLMQALPNRVSKASRNWPGTFLLRHLSITAFTAFHKVIKCAEDEREMPAVWLRVYLKSNIYISTNTQRIF